MINIKHFKEINDLFEATGFSKRTDITDFYILKFEELTSHSVYHMPPYRKDFYQIGLIKNLKSDTKIQIDTQTNSSVHNSLFFLSPDHIYSWTRSKQLEGYIIYFKSNMLNLYKGDLKKDFSFFDLSDQNSFELSSHSLKSLCTDLDKLYTEFYTSHSFRYQILQSSLLSILFKIKGLKELTLKDSLNTSPKEQLAYKFENLVHNCFRTEHKTEFYLNKLNISISYLNKVLKEIKHKTAKEIILNTILKEAKKDLIYNQLSIAEVAYNLGFEEPTHFTRFFKKHTSLTPKAYQRQITT